MPQGRYGARHLSDGAYQFLHVNPLDAAIGHLLAPYQPSKCHGHYHHHGVKIHYHTFLLRNLVLFGTQNGPCTQRIVVMSFI
jgi:hypothetical protein